MDKAVNKVTPIDWEIIKKQYDFSEEIRDDWTVTEKTKKFGMLKFNWH